MKSFRSISLGPVLDDPRALPWRPTRHEIYKYWLCLLLIFLGKCAILYNRIKLSSTVAFAHSFIIRRLASPTLNNTGTPCPATLGVTTFFDLRPEGGTYFFDDLSGVPIFYPLGRGAANILRHVFSKKFLKTHCFLYFR